MARFRYLIASILLLLLPQTAFAQERHVQVDLVAETDRPAPGSEVTLAFASVPQPEWHAYWENPGDAGMPAKASWTLPQGVTAGPIRYPVPERLIIAGLMNYVYEHPFAQLVTLKIPAGLAAGTALPVRVKFDYLVCTKEMCVPETTYLSTTLTVGDGAVAPERRARFDGWRAAMPRPLDTAATYQIAGKVFRLGVPFPASAAADGDAYFYPLTDGAVDYAAPQKVVRDGDRFVVEVPAKQPKGAVQGLLAFGKAGFVLTANPGTVPPASATSQSAPSGWLGTAAIAFLGAILGGLILNIMPCVFPILSLKALSLATGGGSGAGRRGGGLAYTAGVVLTCLVLGGVLLGLRAGGAAVGWAFQLTDPRVVLVLLLLVTGIAFNLAGLFELSAPRFVNQASAKGQGGAFVTGALAAFVATPCTGPFMGAALGAALVLPWYGALLVFAGLGLGLALPFLLLGFVPALRRRLPKPGAWMDEFRKILSVPMFLTAVALAWVLGKQAGVDGMALALLVTLAVGVVLWLGGRRQHRGLSFGAAAWAGAAMATVAGVWLIDRAPPAEAAAASGRTAFSEAKLAELRAQNKPVFAYFTADWCVTCKVNEKAVIETDAVRQALADGKVEVLVGDWTNGDPALGRFIEQHNRAGVPLYLWYKPGEEARVLPQVLTQSMLRDLANGRS